MGEYVSRGQHTIKLGTCEDLYYTTYEELKRMMPFLKSQPGNLEPKEYLNPKYGFRYRFPFYEKTENERYDNFDRGFLIKIPKNLIPGFESPFVHKRKYTTVNVPPYGLTYNMTHKCPLDSEREDIFGFTADDVNFLFELVQQKVFEGELQTVIRCPYCGAKSRLARESIEQVASIILNPETNFTEQTEENIRIALMGYTDFRPYSE